MNIEEAIKQCNDLINDFENGNGLDIRVNATDIQAIETVLKELGRKDVLNKASAEVIENSILKEKIKEKIEELKQDNFKEPYYFARLLLEELLKETNEI